MSPTYTVVVYCVVWYHALHFVLDFIIQLRYYGKWTVVNADDLQYDIHFLFCYFLEKKAADTFYLKRIYMRLFCALWGDFSLVNSDISSSRFSKYINS
jgi:hypothetical protein